jgi:hypothetical protein
MPLSKDEQRRLDEIEQYLRDEDPSFVSEADFDHLRRRRLIVGALMFLAGMAALIVGEIATQAMPEIGVVVSLGGFGAMVAAVGWTLRRSRH